MSDINMHGVCEISSNIAKYDGFMVHSFTGKNKDGHKVSIYFFTDDTQQLVVKETTHQNYCKPEEPSNANE